jgi:hypothetical protein
MIDAGFTNETLAERLDINARTVQRWVTLARLPQPEHRTAVAALVEADEAALWPPEDRNPTGVITVHPSRAAIPASTWARLLTAATDRVEVLAWAATFFHQLQPRLADQLAAAAARGVRVRLCFGDPAGEAVERREHEEGPFLGPGVLAAKIRVSLAYVRPALEVPGVEVRLHDVVVYASLFRYDDQMIANPHVWSRPASENPALHLRTGSLLGAYAASFDAVWDTAKPWDGETQ